jgi:hypothetical protein
MTRQIPQNDLRKEGEFWITKVGGAPHNQASAPAGTGSAFLGCYCGVSNYTFQVVILTDAKNLCISASGGALAWTATTDFEDELCGMPSA